MSRIALGKTALRVLQYLDDHGPTRLSHGSRYASFGPSLIRVMQSTNYLLRASGMVVWAGGNYERWHVRLTNYGRECLTRRSHDGRRLPDGFPASYGPSDDAALLADGNAWYSAGQIEEMGR